MREVEIEIPDALAGLFGANGRGDGGSSVMQAARGAAARRAAQAAPVLAKVGASTASTAGKAAVQGAALASSARDLADTVTSRTREEWLPAARARLDEARPAATETLQTTATRAGQIAAVAGMGARMGAKTAVQGVGDAVRGALGATASALGQLFSLVFWFAVVVWLLLRIFFPRREQRERLYQRVRKYTGMEL